MQIISSSIRDRNSSSFMIPLHMRIDRDGTGLGRASTSPPSSSHSLPVSSPSSCSVGLKSPCDQLAQASVEMSCKSFFDVVFWSSFNYRPCCSTLHPTVSDDTTVFGLFLYVFRIRAEICTSRTQSVEKRLHHMCPICIHMCIWCGAND